MSAKFFKSLLERAVKTFAQALVAILTVDGVTDLLSVGWAGALSAAGLAALVSVLTSIASSPFGDPESPSLVDER